LKKPFIDIYSTGFNTEFVNGIFRNGGSMKNKQGLCKGRPSSDDITERKGMEGGRE